jgi:hypothetical protein
MTFWLVVPNVEPAAESSIPAALYVLDRPFNLVALKEL